MSKQQKSFVNVVNYTLANGERLPLLVYTETYIPVYLATRWAIRYRRYSTQSSTLRSNLRVLGRLFTWAYEIHDLDLQQLLLTSDLVEAELLDSLTSYLKDKCRIRSGEYINANNLNNHLNIICQFLCWSLSLANRGGDVDERNSRLAQRYTRLHEYFSYQRLPNQPSIPHRPLSNTEALQIYQAIGPIQISHGHYQFPKGIFSEQTALRNFLMFETALKSGARIGEILKLTVDSLPRRGDALHIKRLPDDPYDSRTYEPAVKTKERKVPIPQELRRILTDYIESHLPAGRPRGTSPYLFLTHHGAPVSMSTAHDIIEKVGRYSQVSGLTWHRLRHTFAEKMASICMAHPAGADYLQYLMGWSSAESARPYTEEELARQAMEILRTHKDGYLFDFTTQQEKENG